MKNLDSHRSRNMKLGMTFLTTVMYAMLNNSIKIQMRDLVLMSIERAMGGDLLMMAWDPSYASLKFPEIQSDKVKLRSINNLNEEGLTDFLNT